jgi:TolA-binding protein
MISKNFKVAAFSLFAAVGCDPYQSKPAAVSETTSTVTLEDVKRDAAKSADTTATYSQQNKDKLLMDMKEQMATMEANIEKLRLQGQDLVSDAKRNWELKMVDLEAKRKLANEKLEEIGASTSQAWGDVEKGVHSAWDELAKAFRDASKEF